MFKRFAFMQQAGAAGAAGGGAAGAGGSTNGGAAGAAGAAGAGGAGGAGAAGAAGAAGGGAAGAAGDKAPPLDAAALQAQIAALQAKLDAADADKAAAAKKAADEAEAARQSKLSADQKLAEDLAKQRAELDATKAAIVTERRNLALDRAGVAEKYRAFAPQVDPADPAGAKALDAWVRDNPALLVPGKVLTDNAPKSVIDEIKQSGSALAKVLDGTRKSTLVNKTNLSMLK